MGKRCIKCLVCGCEKENCPELKFHYLPGKRERREIWLINLKKSDLINTTIPQDLRVCDKHFSSEMFGKSYKRLKKTAIPIKLECEFPSASRMNNLENIQLNSPKSPKGTEIAGNSNEEFMAQLPLTSYDANRPLIKDELPDEIELIPPKSAIGTEIAGCTNEELMAQLPGTSYDDNSPFIFPVAHKSTRTGSSNANEDEVRNLHRDRKGWRREIWLINLNKSDLINTTIRQDLRICGKHFSADMFGKTKQRLKQTAVPFKEACEIPSAESINISEEIELIPPKSAKGTEIAGISNEELMAQLPGTSYDDNSHLRNLHHDRKGRGADNVETDCVKLINLVKERPALYNAGCMQYRDSNKRIRLWDEVFAGMIENWHTLEEAEKIKLGGSIQEKWYSIRSNFSREVELLKRSATETSAYKSSKFLHFQELMFLIPHLYSLGDEGDANASPQIIDAEPVPGPSMSSSNKRKKGKRISSTKAIMKVLKKRLKSLRGKNDEDERFLLSLLPSIKKYDDDSRLKLRMEILSTVLNFKDVQSNNVRVHIATPSNIAFVEPIPAGSSSTHPTNSDPRIWLPPPQVATPDLIPQTFIVKKYMDP